MAVVVAAVACLLPVPARAASAWGGLPPVWFVGDSIAVGMHQAFGRPQDSETARLGARTSAIVPEVVARLGSDPDAPGLMIVSLGTNNPRTDEAGFQRDAEALLDAAGGRCVAWLTIHRSKGSATWNALNAVLLRLAPRYPNLRIFDWHEYASGDSGATGADRIHPATRAYPVIRNRIGGLLKRCMGR